MPHIPAFRPLGALAAAALTLAAACGDSPVAPAASRAATANDAATAAPPASHTSAELVGGVVTCPNNCQIQTIIASKRISFSESRIMLLEASSGGVMLQLTSGAIDTDPAYSPDRSKIAFLSNRDGGGLFVMNADGSAMQKLAPAVGVRRGVSWNPDGTSIIFSASPNGTGDIFYVNVATKNVIPLTYNPADDHSPAWVTSTSWVWTSNKETGSPQSYDLWYCKIGEVHTRLTNTPTQSEVDPAPAPGGAKIAFVVRGVTSSWSELRVGAPTAAGVASAVGLWGTLGSNHTLGTPSFSLDGNYVMATLTSYGMSRLVRNKATGGDYHKWITPEGVSFAMPGWFN